MKLNVNVKNEIIFNLNVTNYGHFGKLQKMNWVSIGFGDFRLLFLGRPTKQKWKIISLFGRHMNDENNWNIHQLTLSHFHFVSSICIEHWGRQQQICRALDGAMMMRTWRKSQETIEIKNASHWYPFLICWHKNGAPFIHSQQFGSSECDW